MIQPKSLDQLVAADPLVPVQKAIVTTLWGLLPGVSVEAHPGKVDLSELTGKSVVTAPGIGIGWSRIRRTAVLDGSFGAAVEWVAYIIAEPKIVAGRRVEKEVVGAAIGGQLLRILSDDTTCFWGRTGILPPLRDAVPELKPLFTIKDAAQQTAYYVVTWTQTIADIGATHFPTATGRTDPEHGTIDYADQDAIDAIAHFLPALEVPEEGDA